MKDPKDPWRVLYALGVSDMPPDVINAVCALEQMGLVLVGPVRTADLLDTHEGFLHPNCASPHLMGQVPFGDVPLGNQRGDPESATTAAVHIHRFWSCRSCPLVAL